MVKIASVQINLGNNSSLVFESIKEYLEKAKKKNIDLVCFPECTLKQGSKKNKVFLSRIAKECRQNKIACIIVGNLKENKKVFNTAVIINSKGKILGKHKKVYICDSRHVHAGTSFDVFNLGPLKIGLAICWDINDPNTVRTLAKKGAKVVFCPMYWNYELWSHSKNHLLYEKKILKSLVLARAYENLIYVVFCNPINPSRQTLTPYSAIAEPHKILKEIFNKEGMIEAEIDLEYIEHVRGKYLKEYNKKV